MRGLSDRFTAAVSAVDAANADDPNRVLVRGETLPLALAHGRLAAEWVAALHPDAEETWLLAARAHHLRRWELPRASYPDGRAGYHRWKRDQRQRHARDVEALLVDTGYGATEIERVQALIRREALATDPGSQAVEDGACLAFLETQLGDVAAKLDHDHLVDVIRKTARKMSPAALDAVERLPLTDAQRALLAQALADPSH